MRSTLIIVIAALFLIAALQLYAFAHNVRIVQTYDVKETFTVSAFSLPFFLRKGSMYAVYRGTLNGTARLSIKSNYGRQSEIVPIGPGKFSDIYGAPEAWADNISITFVPGTATQGNIYAAVYLGQPLSKEDRELFPEYW